jgi:hypothetical protein
MHTFSLNSMYFLLIQKVPNTSSTLAAQAHRYRERHLTGTVWCPSDSLQTSLRITLKNLLINYCFFFTLRPLRNRAAFVWNTSLSVINLIQFIQLLNDLNITNSTCKWVYRNLTLHMWGFAVQQTYPFPCSGTSEVSRAIIKMATK